MVRAPSGHGVRTHPALFSLSAASQQRDTPAADQALCSGAAYRRGSATKEAHGHGATSDH
jgi:hypothetical protein